MHGGWPHFRPAVLSTFAGVLLTIVTMVLCFLNDIKAQPAIALAMLAIVLTVGGLIGMLVPDAWTAWRRGFQQGCEAATRCQTDQVPGKTVADATPPGPSEQVHAESVRPLRHASWPPGSTGRGRLELLCLGRAGTRNTNRRYLAQSIGYRSQDAA
jgi:hypothetical protein